jgi:hypothetical protein
MNDAVKRQLRLMFRRLRQSSDLHRQDTFRGYIWALSDTDTISMKTRERLMKAMVTCCMRV